jgi:transcriptional regulator with XRE-family HTH domain
MTADNDVMRENKNEGLRSQLGALRNRLAAADPKFNAAARVEREAEALCDEVRSDLKAYRHTLGVSQKELAERVELGQSAISKIESGRGDLSLKTVFRIADALGLRPVLAFAPAAHGAEERLAAEAVTATAALASAVQEDLLRKIPDIVQEAVARVAAAD